MKPQKCVLEIDFFANDVTDLLAERDNSFLILRYIFSIFSAIHSVIAI